MALLDLVKSSARAVASTLSLESRAKAMTMGDRVAAPAQVPQDVAESMKEQGMVAGGAFSPGEPIPPYQPVGTPPIITPYQVGENIFMVPRGTTGVGFDTLQNITSRWDVARLCIEVRLDELRGLDWDIVCDEDEDADRYASELKRARDFFEHPNAYDDFEDLQLKAAEDWLRYDAMTIAKRRSRNGKLAELEVIDGTTIAPLIDARGATPRGPSPAYVQWAWGLPWAWMTTDDIIYKPHHPRPETRYGLAPAEWVLLTANTDLRLQWYFLTYFTRGEVPEAFVNAPPDAQDPKQVKALQNAYSSVMSGAAAGHHQIKWIPPGASVHLVNKANFDVNFAQFILAKACAAWKVQPVEIGFTEKSNRSTGTTQEDVTFRRSVKPAVRYFESMWNRVLRDLGMPYARFKYLDIEEEEDQLKLAQTRRLYIESAVLSADEVRQDLGLAVDPDNPVGRAFVGRTGIVFVDAESQAAARARGTVADIYSLGTGEDDEPDDSAAALSPNQATVDPELKPAPLKPPNPQPQGAAADIAKAAQDDLRKWRQVALKRAKEGKPQREFGSVHIDPMAKALIAAQLQKATSPDDVRAVFEVVLRDPKAPEPVSKKATATKPVAMDRAKRRAAENGLKAAVQAMLEQVAEDAAQEIGTQMKSASGTGSTSLAANIVLLDLALSQFGWPGWDDALKSSVTDGIKAAYRLGTEEAMKAAGAEPEWQMIDHRAIKFAEQRGAELVGKRVLEDGTVIDNPNAEYVITEETRKMLREHVVSALKDGQSPYELEQTIKDAYAFSPQRSETIARTETGFAYNHGSLDGYREAGLTHVLVSDGDYDAACAAADGEIWTLEHAEANPLQHPNCLIGETLVLAANVDAAFARWFEGEVVVLRTAAHDLLTCTPNHPILTDRGWVAAGLLKKGDNVIRSLDGQRVMRLFSPDDEQVPTAIEEVARAVLKSPAVTTRAVPSSTEDFHGDGMDREIYVVGANRFGDRGLNATLVEHGGKRELEFAGMSHGAFLAEGTPREIFGRPLHAANGIVGRVSATASLDGAGLSGCEALAVRDGAHRLVPSEVAADLGGVNAEACSDLIRRQLLNDVQLEKYVIRRHLGVGATARTPKGQPGTAEEPCESASADSDRFGDAWGRLAPLITGVEVVDVQRRQFAGHVYNLQTASAWYIASNIITHNCVRAFSPVVDDEEVE